MSSSLSNGAIFGALMLFSIVLVVAYYRGGRKNLRIIKATADMLEDTFKPSDKNYTWLGGTVGFKAEYGVSGFEKVEILVTVLPRQSLLYLPFALFRGSRDRIEIIVFLKNRPDAEFHLIQDGELRHTPALKTKDLKELEDPELDGYRLFVSNPDSASVKGLLKRKEKFFTPYLRHLAIVPDRKTLFLSFMLPSSNPSLIAKHIKMIMRELRRSSF